MARVLIVDDEPPCVRLVARIVRLMGMSPCGVCDVVAARELLQQHHFAVLVLDLHIGSQCGIELYEELSPSQQARCLFITGSLSAIEEVTERTHRPVFCKPVSLDRFRAGVAEVVERCGAVEPPPGSASEMCPCCLHAPAGDRADAT